MKECKNPYIYKLEYVYEDLVQKSDHLGSCSCECVLFFEEAVFLPY